MHQFFVEPEQINGLNVVITGRDVGHIRNVLRMKPGEELSVVTGRDNKEYRCGIDRIGEDRIECTLRFIKEENIELCSRITLFQCLPKSDKMELVIQKAVELGAAEIVPVSSARCVVRLDEKREAARLARWRQIAQSAAQQSKRRLIPQVGRVMKFTEALSYGSTMDVRLFPYEMVAGMERTRELIGGIRPGQSVAVFIGPEGGFTPQEVEEAGKAGFHAITLGRRILRTETAGFTVLSWLVYQLEEDFGSDGNLFG